VLLPSFRSSLLRTRLITLFHRVHKLDPDLFDVPVLSCIFNLKQARIEAIIEVRMPLRLCSQCSTPGRALRVGCLALDSSRKTRSPGAAKAASIQSKMRCWTHTKTPTIGSC
jgi:hypothetical protein